MVATMKIIPGLSLTAAPNMPRIPVQTEEEKRIARLPGLIHYFEPDRLAGSPLAAKDRATPGHPIATTSTGITVGVSAGYNNQKVVTKTAAQAAFAYGPGTAPRSFTAIWVADLSAARIAANLGASLWAFYNGSGAGSVAKYALSYRSDLDRFQFAENYASNTSPLLLPIELMPDGDEKFVLAVSHDAETRESCMFINTADVAASITHTGTVPVIDEDTRFAVGGLYQFGSSGWDGHIGRGLLMDRAYHLPAYLPLLATEMAKAREFYVI